MSIKKIDKIVIQKIAKGDKKSFSVLYDCYYTYLNTVALFYIFNKDVANEIVNDVFINVWHKRESLTYPIHSYLIQSVKNGCLNHIRSQQTKERILGEYKKQLLDFQENYILSTPTPLQYVETQEIEKEVMGAIEELPEKCKLIFEHYLFKGKSADEIADELSISVNTVRVQLKNAMDKLRISLGHLITILCIIFFR
ncbi:MAG: RNA polymerase sigma-70 factor [Candidatus Azobacteroides sp.]|nr:RNA polymerase sigma-70 factor [Candidatus Azobacteroides sp.]